MKPHELFKSLGDPTRLRIVALLLEQELCVCDILTVLRLPQSTVSRHMIRLKAAGMVSDRRAGKWVHYRLRPNPLVGELREVLRYHLSHTEPFKKDAVALRKYVANGHCTATE
jgi:ArsR family transcriptional regulator